MVLTKGKGMQERDLQLPELKNLSFSTKTKEYQYSTLMEKENENSVDYVTYQQ
jgi:hypothetical protein